MNDGGAGGRWPLSLPVRHGTESISPPAAGPVAGTAGGPAAGPAAGSPVSELRPVRPRHPEPRLLEFSRVRNVVQHLVMRLQPRASVLPRRRPGPHSGVLDAAHHGLVPQVVVRAGQFAGRPRHWSGGGLVAHLRAPASSGCGPRQPPVPPAAARQAPVPRATASSASHASTRLSQTLGVSAASAAGGSRVARLTVSAAAGKAGWHRAVPVRPRLARSDWSSNHCPQPRQQLNVRCQPAGTLSAGCRAGVPALRGRSG